MVISPFELLAAYALSFFAGVIYAKCSGNCRRAFHA